MKLKPVMKLPAMLLLIACPVLASDYENKFLSDPIRITSGLKKAGEGYFTSDMSRICYQGIPNDKPFYQIFIQRFLSSKPKNLGADSSKYRQRANHMCLVYSRWKKIAVCFEPP
jgi:hypothetical protein